jgi:hypothetical protein
VAVDAGWGRLVLLRRPRPSPHRLATRGDTYIALVLYFPLTASHCPYPTRGRRLRPIPTSQPLPPLRLRRFLPPDHPRGRLRRPLMSPSIATCRPITRRGGGWVDVGWGRLRRPRPPPLLYRTLHHGQRKRPHPTPHLSRPYRSIVPLKLAFCL